MSKLQSIAAVATIIGVIIAAIALLPASALLFALGLIPAFGFALPCSDLALGHLQ